MAIIAHSCSECREFSKRTVGQDPEGEPIEEYRCGDRIMTASETVFGCGLWRKA
ncbi:hypothetical protein PED39_05385 [Methanomassiliicoccales archaeon LGM-RCC1]|nr:hypothetical protein PED39_05385 [Methanomassiliicoccales archaeon LGM-RCC1]